MKLDRKIFIGILVAFLVGISAYFLFFKDNGTNLAGKANSEQSVKSTGELVTAAGQYVDLDDFKGKVVFMNNWASWCRPCIVEMPTIEKLRQTLPADEVEFLLVSFDRNHQKGIDWMDQSPFQLPVYFPGEKLPPQFLTNSIPATFVFNKKGEVVYQHVGMADYSTEVFVSKMRQWIEE